MNRRSQDRLKLLKQRLAAKGVAGTKRQAIPRWQGPGDPPLTFNQQRLWFLDRLEPGTSLYHDLVALRLTGAEIDLGAFRSAFDEVVRRHDSLRSYFVLVDSRPVQKFAPDLVIPIDFVDLRGSTEEERHRAVDERLLSDVRTPLDLGAPPLVRATLLRLSDTEYVFGLMLHHIVSDGASYGIVYAEMSQLYAAYSAGKPSPLVELPVQIGDYAAWERECLADDVLDRNMLYWKAKLGAPLPALTLPTDNPRSGAGRHRGAFHRFRLPDPLFRALCEFCRREQVTSYWVLITAYVAVLHRFSGQEDILLGTPSSCRNHPDLERLIGFFVRTVVIRNDLSGNPTFREMVVRARRTALEAAEHEEVPFDRVVQEVRPEAASMAMPLIQAWFTHMRDMIPPMQLPGIAATYQIVDPKNARFDLALVMDETRGGIEAYLEYDVDLFTPETVARFTERFLTLLRQAINHPDSSLSLMRQTLADKDRTATTPADDGAMSRLRGMKKGRRKPR